MLHHQLEGLPYTVQRAIIINAMGNVFSYLDDEIYPDEDWVKAYEAWKADNEASLDELGLHIWEKFEDDESEAWELVDNHIYSFAKFARLCLNME